LVLRSKDGSMVFPRMPLLLKQRVRHHAWSALALIAS
jgi:hypothetical protein